MTNQGISSLFLGSILTVIQKKHFLVAETIREGGSITEATPSSLPTIECYVHYVMLENDHLNSQGREVLRLCLPVRHQGSWALMSSCTHSGS